MLKIKKRKIICLLYILLLALLGCSSSPQAKDTDEQKGMPERIQFGVSGIKHDWVLTKTKKGIFKEKPVLFITIEIEDKSMDNIKQKLDQTIATESQKMIVQFMMEQVKKILFSKEIMNDKLFEEIKKTAEAYKFAKEETDAVKKIALWWEHFSEPKIDKEQVAGWTPPVFKYYTRAVIDYDLYKKLRTKLILSVKPKSSDSGSNPTNMDFLVKKLGESDNNEDKPE